MGSDVGRMKGTFLRRSFRIAFQKITYPWISTWRALDQATIIKFLFAPALGDAVYRGLWVEAQQVPSIECVL